jgi:hypothetical protein
MTVPPPSGAEPDDPTGPGAATVGATGPWFGAEPTEAQRKRRRGNRITSLVAGVVVVVFGGLRTFTGFHGGHDGNPVWSLLIALAAAALALWLTFAITTSSVRRREAAAREARPGAEVFAAGRAPTLVPALRMAGVSTKGLSRAPIVSVGTAGVELWPRRPHQAPLVTLPWASIDHVEPSHEVVTGGPSAGDARTVRIFATIGNAAYDLPLPIYGPRGLRYANVARANEVMGWFAQYTRVQGTDI